MFAYTERDSYLHRRNPVIKLVVVLLLSLLVSFSYHPAFPLLLFVSTLIFFRIAGKLPFGIMGKRLAVFFVLSFIFMYSMLLLKGIHPKESADFRFGVLTWRRRDIWYVLALGLRILALVTLSLGFVLSTKPRDLIFSLIHQCKLSDVQGYSILAAYRFVPDMQRQAENLYFAQEMRGLFGKGGKNKLLAPFRILLPMLHTAVRRGERVACSMESRGLGRRNPRTYIRVLKADKQDFVFLAGSLLFYLCLIALLYRLDMYRFAWFMSE